MPLFKSKVENKLLVLENEAKYFQQVSNKSFKYEVVSEFHRVLLRSICRGLDDSTYMVFCESFPKKSWTNETLFDLIS